MSIKLVTSLGEILSFSPCMEGWLDVCRPRKKFKDDQNFPLVECLESNSVNDVLWLLEKRNTEVEIIRKFALKCAESVAHLDTKYTRLIKELLEAIQENSPFRLTNLALEISCYSVEAACAANSVRETNYVLEAQQKEKNKQILIDLIEEYESCLSSNTAHI